MMMSSERDSREDAVQILRGVWELLQLPEMQGIREKRGATLMDGKDEGDKSGH